MATLEFRNVSFSYPDGTVALDDVSFVAGKGERVGLLGLNGAGKSTLLLLADALLTAVRGSVEINGIVSSDRTAAEIRRHVGLVFQDADDQLFMPTVEADVAFGPRNMGLSDSEIEARTAEALHFVGCTDLKNRQPFELSGGQKKMVAVATVLSMRPEILLFDEPTAGLDYAARNRFIEIMRSLDITTMLSTHDMELFHSLCTRAIVLDHGRVIYDGPPETVPYPSCL